jgi:aromatic ring-opening dioxygenase LigB subunit
VISRAAVVPHPPLLVAELAGAAAAETADLRAACRDVAARLADAHERWIAVGAAATASRHDADTRGTFAGFGADVRVALSDAADAATDPDLPLPVLVAGWLRRRGVTIDAHVLPADTDPDEARRVGEELAADGSPAALLVLGDGAATHTPRAPGAFDERAAGYDRGVADALAAGDAAALGALDPTLSDELLVAGRVPWQVLAGALPHPSAARLEHSSAPYGVAYHVALWER